MLLVGYLYGIRSERRLVEEAHLNLAYRWFCKLGLEGRVPDAAVDGSTIEADANRDRKDAPQEIEKLWSRKEQMQRPVAEYLSKLADADETAPPGPKKKPPKYLSETDPEAA